jgi:hypothetical protein
VLDLALDDGADQSESWTPSMIVVQNDGDRSAVWFWPKLYAGWKMPT